MIDKLGKLTGAEFDKHYIHHMVKDHEEDVELFSKEATNGNDAQLKEFASSTLKVIQQHLALAKETAPKVGATD